MLPSVAEGRRTQSPYSAQSPTSGRTRSSDGTVGSAVPSVGDNGVSAMALPAVSGGPSRSPSRRRAQPPSPHLGVYGNRHMLQTMSSDGSSRLHHLASGGPAGGAVVADSAPVQGSSNCDLSGGVSSASLSSPMRLTGEAHHTGGEDRPRQMAVSASGFGVGAGRPRHSLPNMGMGAPARAGNSQRSVSPNPVGQQRVSRNGPRPLAQTPNGSPYYRSPLPEAPNSPANQKQPRPPLQAEDSSVPSSPALTVSVAGAYGGAALSPRVLRMQLTTAASFSPHGVPSRSASGRQVIEPEELPARSSAPDARHDVIERGRHEVLLHASMAEGGGHAPDTTADCGATGSSSSDNKLLGELALAVVELQRRMAEMSRLASDAAISDTGMGGGFSWCRSNRSSAPGNVNGELPSLCSTLSVGNCGVAQGVGGSLTGAVASERVTEERLAAVELKLKQLAAGDVSAAASIGATRAATSAGLEKTPTSPLWSESGETPLSMAAASADANASNQTAAWGLAMALMAAMAMQSKLQVAHAKPSPAQRALGLMRALAPPAEARLAELDGRTAEAIQQLEAMEEQVGAVVQRVAEVERQVSEQAARASEKERQLELEAAGAAAAAKISAEERERLESRVQAIADQIHKEVHEAATAAAAAAAAAAVAAPGRIASAPDWSSLEEYGNQLSHVEQTLSELKGEVQRLSASTAAVAAVAAAARVEALQFAAVSECPGSASGSGAGGSGGAGRTAQPARRDQAAEKASAAVAEMQRGLHALRQQVQDMVLGVASASAQSSCCAEEIQSMMEQVQGAQTTAAAAAAAARQASTAAAAAERAAAAAMSAVEALRAADRDPTLPIAGDRICPRRREVWLPEPVVKQYKQLKQHQQPQHQQPQPPERQELEWLPDGDDPASSPPRNRRMSVRDVGFTIQPDGADFATGGGVTLYGVTPSRAHTMELALARLSDLEATVDGLRSKLNKGLAVRVTRDELRESVAQLDLRLKVALEPVPESRCASRAVSLGMRAASARARLSGNGDEGGKDAGEVVGLAGDGAGAAGPGGPGAAPGCRALVMPADGHKEGGGGRGRDIGHGGGSVRSFAWQSDVETVVTDLQRSMSIVEQRLEAVEAGLMSQCGVEDHVTALASSLQQLQAAAAADQSSRGGGGGGAMVSHSRNASVKIRDNAVLLGLDEQLMQLAHRVGANEEMHSELSLLVRGMAEQVTALAGRRMMVQGMRAA